jgi:hypothetical protein
MKPILKAKVPPTAKLGNYTVLATYCFFNTAKQNILRAYNKALESEGHQPVKRMPAGTKYRLVAGFGF